MIIGPYEIWIKFQMKYFMLILMIDGWDTPCEIVTLLIIKISIGLGNGLVPSGNQAITWANVVLDLCRHMASLGHNGLSFLVGWIWLFIVKIHIHTFSTFH